MNYWWVYQGQSFERAFAGGYLWAPQQTKVGGTPFYYWSNVRHVQTDDIVFSHVEGHIVAVGTALGEAYDAPPPQPEDAPQWPAQGWKVDTAFLRVVAPITFAHAYSVLNPLIHGPESPFSQNGRPNQGYLFRLPETAGIALENLLSEASGGNILDALKLPSNENVGLATTTVQSIVLRRIGQARFREKLDRAWGNRCAVSGVATRSLLRASHIKAWSESNNMERLDSENGILLSAAYDAAFDSHLITFDENGTIVMSPQLNAEEANRAGLDPNAKLTHILPGHLNYLAWHRNLLKA